MDDASRAVFFFCSPFPLTDSAHPPRTRFSCKRRCICCLRMATRRTKSGTMSFCQTLRQRRTKARACGRASTATLTKGATAFVVLCTARLWTFLTALSRLRRRPRLKSSPSRPCRRLVWSGAWLARRAGWLGVELSHPPCPALFSPRQRIVSVRRGSIQGKKGQVAQAAMAFQSDPNRKGSTEGLERGPRLSMSQSSIFRSRRGEPREGRQGHRLL